MEHVIPPSTETPKPTTEPTDPDLELGAAADLESESDESTEEEVRERPIVPLKDIPPEVAALGINSFEDLPLVPSIGEAIRQMGWITPTPVQKLCLPYTLRSRDVAGFAQTGTGKTAVFLITILNKLLSTPSPEGQSAGRVPRAIVIAPTRELAMQSEQDAADLFAKTGLKSIAVFGGIDYDKQARDIAEGVDVIFATPGRLKDYIQKKVVRLEDISVFVCDEADRMFDMGFIEDVEFFLARIPQNAQRLLFSATTNDQVKELAFEYLENPEYISVNPETITPEKIEQFAIHCHATEKLRVLLGLLEDHKPDCAVIFTNTKLTAEWLYFKLQHNGVDADLISGDLPQKKRISLIHRIKEGKIKALVATDVASRGLHISRITHVYNFDLPDDAANYIHRIGRTARAGAKGYAYSLVCDDYGQNLTAINDLLGPLAMQTTWPDARYLQIVDKAGNPFEERYAARRERFSEGPSRGRDGGGGRPQQGRDGGRPQGRDQGRGGYGDKSKRDVGPRRDEGQRPQRPQSQHAQGLDANGNGDHKQRNRQRGRGGQERDQQSQSLHQHGAQNGRRSGPVSGHAVVKAHDHDAAPKTMLGMIFKLLKTVFRIAKK